MTPITDEFEMVNRNKNKCSKLSKLILLLLVIIILICISLIVLTNTNKSSTDDNKSKNTKMEVDISKSFHKMIYRKEWGGRRPLYEHPQNTPVKYVIISHTAGAFCLSITTCSQIMTLIQSLHASAGNSDIGYNFLIGGDANIYVARGWDNHNFHMNLDTIGICFIGNYILDQLTPGMVEATHELLAQGVEKGKLEKDYILVGHNQTTNTLSPGENVYKQIKFWPHFSSDNLDDVEEQK